MADAIILQGHLTQSQFDANPSFLLGDGQIVWLKDNSGKFKKGDGITQLSALPFLGGNQTLAQTLANGNTSGASNIIAEQEINMPNERLGAMLYIDDLGNIKSSLIQSNNVELKSNKATTMTGNTTSNILFLSAKAIYDWATGLFELTSNKQNSLSIDGTGVKYATVDSINANVSTKQTIQITSSTAPTVSTTGYRRTFVDITALAGNIDLSTNLSGSPENGDVLWYQIKDNGTARTITMGSLFEAKGEALPTTTVISKRINIGATWDSTTSKWGVIAVAQEL